MTEPAKSLESQTSAVLSFADLDAHLRLKIRSTLGISFPTMYAEFAKQIDVGSLRGKGIASVITSVDVQRSLTPFPVGGAVDVHTSIRLCDYSGGKGRTRLGFEVGLELSALPGTGDRLRYRETAQDAQPVPAGSCTLLLTMLRPSAPKDERFLSEPPPEVQHMAIVDLTKPHASGDSLAQLPPGMVECARRDRESASIVWGLHNTDVNQNVYSGDTLAVLEDAFSALLHEGGKSVDEHQIERASLIFKQPFAPGSRAVIAGTVYHCGDRTLFIANLHGFDEQGAAQARPSIIGRLEGRLGVKRGDPRFAV